VINDCFYFFLRKSEPMYAFHCLAMGEFYLQKVMCRASVDEAHTGIPSKIDEEIVDMKKELRDTRLE